MKKITFCCDRCGEEIQDIVYTVTVYGTVVPGATTIRYEDFMETQAHNERQNTAQAGGIDRHLCRKCKDELTDGLFIV